MPCVDTPMSSVGREFQKRSKDTAARSINDGKDSSDDSQHLIKGNQEKCVCILYLQKVEI